MEEVKVPIWGFGKIEFKEYETESNEKEDQFFKLETSSFIGSVIHIVKKKMETRIYSNEEAFEVAKKMARLDIKNRLSEDAKIIGEKVLHQSVDNGKVTISIHFQVIENIATGETNYPRRVRMTEELKTMNVQLNNSNEAIALIGNSDANLKSN